MANDIPLNAKLGTNELAARENPKDCLPYMPTGKSMEDAMLAAQTLQLQTAGWTGENCRPTHVESDATIAPSSGKGAVSVERKGR